MRPQYHNPNIEDPIEAAYWAGVEAGMRRFAWWKDGCEHVGTCGTSLKRAIRNMDTESGKPCWHPRSKNYDGIEYCMRCGIAANDKDIVPNKNMEVSSGGHARRS